MMWHIRRQLEQKGKTIDEAVSSIAQGRWPRYAFLWERMCKRAGLPIDYSNIPDKTAIDHLRVLYSQACGSLPSYALKPLKNVRVLYTIALPAFRDVDNTTASSDQPVQPDDDQGGGDSGSDQANDSDRINTTNTDTTVDAVAKAGNQSPRGYTEGCNVKDINAYAPSANQLANKVKRALLTDSKSRISRFRDSGNIDMQRLTDIGTLSDIQNVYQRVAKGRALNACVQVYVDCSISMHGHRMTAAVVTAAVLGTVFESLRVPYQLIAFEDCSRVIKNWSGKWRNSDLTSLDVCGGTNSPRSFRSCIPNMLSRREQRKIAIILTDGDLSSTNDMYDKGGDLTQWKKAGVEMYAIGIYEQVLCCDPALPHVDYWNTVGVGNHVEHYGSQTSYNAGAKPDRISEGFNGGIDNVSSDTLLPKLSAHVVDVFTEGRQTIK